MHTCNGCHPLNLNVDLYLIIYEGSPLVVLSHNALYKVLKEGPNDSASSINTSQMSHELGNGICQSI